MTGPRAKEPGYDYILQGLAGWMAHRRARRTAHQVGLSLVDYSGGFVAAISLLAGVHARPPRRRRDGLRRQPLRHRDRDADLPGTWHLNAGFTPRAQPHSAHPSLVPFQAFEATDGWMVVGCAKEKFWQRLCDVSSGPT